MNTQERTQFILSQIPVRSVRSIAAELGLSPQAVYKHVKKGGGELREPSGSEALWWKPLLPKLAKEINVVGIGITCADWGISRHSLLPELLKAGYKYELEPNTNRRIVIPPTGKKK